MNNTDNLRKRILDRSLLVSLIFSVLGSIIYTLIDILELLQRRGWDFVVQTFRYNLTTFLLAVTSFVPAGIWGTLLGFWIWVDFHNGNFSLKKSIQKGLIIGVASGLFSTLVALYNSIHRLGLRSFQIELVTGLILWVVGGSLVALFISNFIEKKLKAEIGSQNLA